MPIPADWSDRVLAEFIELSVNIIRSILDELATNLRAPVCCIGPIVAPDVLKHEIGKFCEELGRYNCKVQLLARTLEKLTVQTNFTRNLVKHLNTAGNALESALARLRVAPTTTHVNGVRAFFLAVADEVKRSVPALESAHDDARKRKEELNNLAERTQKEAIKAIPARIKWLGGVLSIFGLSVMAYGTDLHFANDPVPPDSYVVIAVGLVVAIIGGALTLPLSFKTTPRAK